jgi:hypothetical protein
MSGLLHFAEQSGKHAVRSDNRKATRQPLTYPSAVITEDGTRQECRFADISAGGARLEVKDPERFPDKFILVLSERGKVMRRCEVIWRSEKYLGVRFQIL